MEEARQARDRAREEEPEDSFEKLEMVQMRGWEIPNFELSSPPIDQTEEQYEEDKWHVCQWHGWHEPTHHGAQWSASRNQRAQVKDQRGNWKYRSTKE